jgi:hypothetical protein
MLTLLGYTAMYWALGGVALRGAFIEAGSLFTFAFQAPLGIPQTILAYSEAALGLGLVALLISYLPSLYSASRDGSSSSPCWRPAPATRRRSCR